MRDTVVISLGRFSENALKIASFLDADMLPYDRDSFQNTFGRYRKIVALMSVGIVVRNITPLLADKWTDPAVVAVSPDMKFAIPLTGGHHGANQLARKLETLGMTAVISTATETMGKEAVEQVAERMGSEVLNKTSTRQVNASMLDSDVPLYAVNGPGMVIVGPVVSVLLKKGEYMVGIGCNKGVGEEEVSRAITAFLKEAKILENQVMAFVTTDKKRREKGLIDAVSSLGSNLVFIDDDTINAQIVTTPSKASMIGLKGVAEPCALAMSKHKELVVEKKIYGNITIALAR
jgi:cobalt-precorrin 5A hydrolase